MMYEMKTPHNLRCSPVYNHTMPDAYNKKDGITYQMFDHTFTEEELKCDLEAIHHRRPYKGALHDKSFLFIRLQLRSGCE